MTTRIARLVLVAAALVMLQTCQVADAFGRKKKKKSESMAAVPPPLLQATCVNASRVFGLNVEDTTTTTPASAIELREDLSLYWHYPNETTVSGNGVAPLVVRLYYEPKMVDDEENDDDKSSAEEAWVSVGFSGTKNKAGHDVPGSIVVVGSSDLVQQNDPRGIGGVGLYYLMPIPSNFTAAEDNDGGGAGGAGSAGVGMVEYHSDVRNNMLRHSALEHYFLYDPAEEGNLSTRMTFELQPALVEQLLDTQAAPTLSSLLEEDEQQQKTEQTREEEAEDDSKDDIVVTLMYAIGRSSSLGSYHRHRGSFQVILNQCWDVGEPEALTGKQEQTLDISSAGAVPVVGSSTTTEQQQKEEEEKEEATLPPSPQEGEEEEEGEEGGEESTEGGAGDAAAEQEEEPQPDEAAAVTPEASENANATQDANTASAQQQQQQQPQPPPAAGGSAVAFVIHGTIAAVAFGILIPGAMIVAWFRMACPSAWVYIHVSLHGVGFLLGLVSIFIALGAGPWGDSSNHATTQHGWMGLFVLLLVVFQIANGCLRPSLVPKHGSSSTHGGGGDRDNSSNHSASSTASLVPGGGEKPKLAPPRRCCPSGMDTRNRWYWMHRCVAVTVLILVAAQIHSGIQLYGRRFGPGRTREVLVVFWVYASTLAAGLLGLRLYFWCDQPPRPPPQRQQRGPHHQQLQRQESLSLSAPPDENNNKMDKMKKMLSFSKRKKKRRGDGDNGGLGSMHWGNDSRTNFSYDAQNLQMHRRPSDDSLGNEFGDDDDDDDVDVTDDFNDEALMRAFTNNGNIGNNNSSNNNMGKSKAMSINVV